MMGPLMCICWALVPGTLKVDFGPSSLEFLKFMMGYMDLPFTGTLSLESHNSLGPLPSCFGPLS